jgi:methionyl aminopeptidase
MLRKSKKMIPIKTEAELAKMLEAGQLTARILHHIGQMAAPGISTWELDQEAERLCLAAGARSAFKGYHGYPYAVCCSVNQQVVHGFPVKSPLEDGDIVSLDFGVVLDGFYGDTAITVPVGRISPEALNLVTVTRDSLAAGINQVKAGAYLGDIGAAVQEVAEKAGYSVVRQFVGHGIGKAMHEEPSVPNFGIRGHGPKLQAGMVLAIEPMINMGRSEVKILEDGWTAVTIDGKLSAHFEHTVAVTAAGYNILTLPPIQ